MIDDESEASETYSRDGLWQFLRDHGCFDLIEERINEIDAASEDGGVEFTDQYDLMYYIEKEGDERYSVRQRGIYEDENLVSWTKVMIACLGGLGIIAGTSLILFL